MAFNIKALSLVFDNPDLLREIGMFVEPRLPIHFVFHAAREAFIPLEEKDKKGNMVISSVKWKFCCSISMVKWITKNFCRFCTSPLISSELVARGGSLDVVKWFLSKDCEFSYRNAYLTLFHKSSQFGQIEILKYLCSRFPEISTEFISYGYVDSGIRYPGCCCGAAESGSMEAVEILRSLNHPVPFCDFCSTKAAKGGNIEILELIYLSDFFSANMSICGSAAEGGHIHILQWLRSLDPPCPWGEDVSSVAAYKGHLHVLQWLRAQDPPCPWDSSLCVHAAQNQFFHVLEWARSQDPPAPWDEEVCNVVVKNGRLDMLEWLRTQDPPCPWDEDACLSAVETERFDILQWLRSQDPPCPWDEEVCFTAVKNNAVITFQWLRTQNPPCPWDALMCWREAARKGNVDILNWMIEQNLTIFRHPSSFNPIMATNIISYDDKINIIMRLRALNPPCPWDTSVLISAVQSFHLDIVDFLRAQDPPCPWDHTVLVSAVETSFLGVVEHLRAMDPPCPWSHEVSSQAVSLGSLNILKWLRSQDPPCPWSENTCAAAF